MAILIVTVLIKALFFPLANKSYESMSKMKKLQPEMERLKQLYPDDRMKQQQELMDLYKKEKVSPLSGCLPIIIQIPVFFALYKVLFVTIEMRHAPFFGWIKDLSAPDPTSLFNLFGLIPWDSAVAADGGNLADHHGHHHVDADASQSDASRSHPGDDVQLDAADLHLHAGELSGGAGDLLGMEQQPVDPSADADHEATAAWKWIFSAM